MTPLKTWKANKWRSDLRSYTREFEKKFESTSKVTILPGAVYAAKYRTSSDFPTDKHHFTPVFVSFGRFRTDEGKNHVRGINLFYLKNEQKIELLEEVYKCSSKKPDDRVAPMIKIHEKWMKIVPYAFKNFEERRIVGIEEVSNKEWGMIPLLHEYLFGTFNAVALNEDFQKENTVISKKPVIKKSPKTKPIEGETISEDIITTESDNNIDFEENF